MEITRQDLRTAVAAALQEVPELTNKQRYALMDVAQEARQVAFGEDYVDDVGCPARQANVLGTEFPNVYDRWLYKRGYKGFPGSRGVLNVID